MQLTDLTSYDTIRFILGVSEDEIEDAMLGQEVLWLSVQQELFYLQAMVPYTAVAAKVSTQTPLTDAEQWVYNAVRLFVPYSVGVQLRTSLPLIAPKDITDGKAKVSRDSNTPFALTMEEVTANYHRFKVDVQQALVNYAGQQVTRQPIQTYVAGSSPQYDPIKGPCPPLPKPIW